MAGRIQIKVLTPLPVLILPLESKILIRWLSRWKVTLSVCKAMARCYIMTPFFFSFLNKWRISDLFEGSLVSLYWTSTLDFSVSHLVLHLLPRCCNHNIKIVSNIIYNRATDYFLAKEDWFIFVSVFVLWHVQMLRRKIDLFYKLKISNFTVEKLGITMKQECIPVGCVPTTVVATTRCQYWLCLLGWGVRLLGGFAYWGTVYGRGLLTGRVCLLEGRYLLWRDRHV